jgi:segregation and condensation protein B
LDFLQNHIESLIFCSQDPISIEEMQSCLVEMFDADVPIDDIKNALTESKEKYALESYPFEIVKSGGGYQFLTKPAYQASISILLKQKSKKRLSNSAVETLSIIAYKQPIAKSGIEAVRGVGCDYTIQKLLEKELISIKGKSESVGRPILYGTSEKFLDYFGINSVSELPTIKDFKEEENEIGEVREE